MTLTLRKQILQFGPVPPVAAAPTLISVTPIKGPSTGNQSLALVGTGFAVGMRVYLDGLLCLSIVRTDSAHATCLTPPSPDGIHQITVVNPDGQSSNQRVYTTVPGLLGTAAAIGGASGTLTITPASFDPGTLNPNGWWRADFPAPPNPWLPSPGGGSSGTNGNLVASAAFGPNQGTAVNGRIPALVTGSGGTGATAGPLKSVAAASTFINPNAITVIIIAKYSGAPAAPAANYYDDVAFASDGPNSNGGNWAITLSSAGVRAGMFTGTSGTVQTPSVPLATDTYAVMCYRLDRTASTTDALRLRVYTAGGGIVDVNGSTGPFNPLNVGNFLELMQNYVAAAPLPGSVLDVLTFATVLSDTDLDNVALDYANARYALGFAFDLAALDLSIRLKLGDLHHFPTANTTVWIGSASAGTSGDSDGFLGFNTFPDGPLLDGVPTVDFSAANLGARKLFLSPGNVNARAGLAGSVEVPYADCNASGKWSLTTGTAWALVYLLSIPVDADVFGSGTRGQIGVRSAGQNTSFGINEFNSGITLLRPSTLGAWAVLTARWGPGVPLFEEFRINKGAWASSNINNFGTGTQVALGLNGTAPANMYAADFGGSLTQYDNAICDKIYDALKALYPGAALP